MLCAVQDLFYVYLSCRKGSDQSGMGTQTACFVLSFPPTLSFLLSPVQGLSFIWRSVTAASLSSLALLPDFSLLAASPWFSSPSAPSQPARMHVQPWFSLHHLERSAVALGGGGRSGPSDAAACCPLALSLPSTCGSTPALPCCLCKCWTRRQTV